MLIKNTPQLITIIKGASFSEKLQRVHHSCLCVIEEFQKAHDYSSYCVNFGGGMYSELLLYAAERR